MMKALCPALLLGAILCGGCTQNTVQTPTRVLDGPSDTALFCIDFDLVGNQQTNSPADCDLPVLDRSRLSDVSYLQAFVNDYCNAPAPALPTDLSLCQAPVGQRQAGVYCQTALVLDPQECDGPHRQKRIDYQLTDLRDALQLINQATPAGQTLIDLNTPCCPADNPTCGVAPPICSVRRLEALVTNTTRGEVAAVDTQVGVAGLNTIGQIENLQSGKPGFGFLPVGLQPGHVRTYAGQLATAQNPPRTTAPAAWGVTTNAGSCDLSYIDLNQVANLVVHPTDCSGASCPRRLVPYTVDPAVPLGARPSWVEPLPWKGQAPHAMVAFPGCGLVADVDLSTGQLREGVSFDDAGNATVLRDLSALRCATECASGTAGSDSPFVPQAPDGGTLAAGSYPSTLAVFLDPDRSAADSILVGDGRHNRLTLLPFDPEAADGQHLVGQPQLKVLAPALQLAGTRAFDEGIDVVRVSPVTRSGTFAYLVNRDGTVRVLNLDPDNLYECETNPDARYLQELAIAGPGRPLPDELYEQTDANNYNVNARRLVCLPVGQTPRSPLYSSPGIALNSGALPRDVAFIHIDIPCDPSDINCPYYRNLDPVNGTVAWVLATPLVWIGDYAWILGSDGNVQAVQINDYCPLPSYRACFPEQGALRRATLLQTRSLGLPTGVDNGLPALPDAVMVTPQDRLGNTSRRIADRINSASPILSRFDDSNPGPRVVANTQQQPFTARVGGTAITVSSTSPAAAPASFYYLPVDPVCDVALADPANKSMPQFRPTTIAAFPDPLAVRDENWNLAWEGVLPGLARHTGRLLADQADPTQAILIDLAGQYCDRGVEPGDKLWLPGCNTNTDCPIGQCVREQSLGDLPGICLPGLQQGDECHRLTQPLTLDRPTADTNGVVWAASWTTRYRLVRAQVQQDKTYPPPPGGGSTNVTEKVDVLTLAESAEPEFEIQQVRCDGPDLNLNYGDKCPDAMAAVHEATAAQTDPVQFSTYCHADLDRNGQSIRRCVMECDNSSQCGQGFVCAHSSYEQKYEGRLSAHGRCLRAPLIAQGTPLGMGGQQSLSHAQADQIATQCFPNLLAYEVHGGDAFVAVGDITHAPVLEKTVNGECQRPGDKDPKELFQAARLLQPRLRLGPRALPSQSSSLPSCAGDWISHHLTSPAPPASSCQGVIYFLNQGSGVTLPAALASTTVFPKVVSASALFSDPQHTPGRDPWLHMEDELFGSLPLSQGNACILDPAAESLAGAATCPDQSTAPCPRRVHYENTVVNLVMSVPRYPGSTSEWLVPLEDYVVTFQVTGGSTPYYLPAQVPAGQLAQGLRTAAAAPDGSVFLVDEGRNASLTGLRGQLMRLVGSTIDTTFLVR